MGCGSSQSVGASDKSRLKLLNINVASVPPVPLEELDDFKKKYISNSYLHDKDQGFQDRRDNCREIQYTRWDWMQNNPKIFVNMLRVSNHNDDNIQACLDNKRPLCFTTQVLYDEYTRDLAVLKMGLENETSLKNVRFIQAGSSVAGFSNNPFKGFRDAPSKMTDTAKSDVDVVVVGYGAKELIERHKANGSLSREYEATTSKKGDYAVRYGLKYWDVIPPINEWIFKWKQKMGGGVQVTLQDGDPIIPPWESTIILPNIVPFLEKPAPNCILNYKVSNVRPISDTPAIEEFKQKYLSNEYLHDDKDPQFQERLKNTTQIQFTRWDWMQKNPEIYINMLRLSNHKDENIQACLDGKRPLCFTSIGLYSEFTAELRDLKLGLEEETELTDVRYIQAGSSVAGFSNNPFKGFRDRPSKITDANKSDVDVVIVANGVKSFIENQRARGLIVKEYQSTTARNKPMDVRLGLKDWSAIPSLVTWMNKWKIKMGGGIQITMQEGNPVTPPWEPYIILPKAYEVTPILKVNVKNVKPVASSEIDGFKKKYLSNEYIHEETHPIDYKDRKQNLQDIQFRRWDWMQRNPDIYVNMLRQSNHKDETIQACMDGRKPLCFISEEIYAEFTRDLKGLRKSLEEPPANFLHIRFIQAGSSVAGFSNNPFKGFRNAPSKITDVSKSDVDVVCVAYGVKDFLERLKTKDQNVKIKEYPSTTTKTDPMEMRYGLKDWDLLPAVKAWMDKWLLKMGGGVQVTLQEGDPKIPPWEPYIILPRK